jgi:hypothetical protein
MARLFQVVAAGVCIFFVCGRFDAALATDAVPEAKKVTDPTGMDRVQQLAGAELARQLAGRTEAESCINTPLSGLLDFIAADVGLKLKTDGLPAPKEQGKSKRYAVTADFKGKAVQEVLRAILTAADCHCTLEMDVLVIRPNGDK